MKTIATFGDSLTANLAKSRLADAGIDAYLANEENVAMAWHLVNAIGGIRLQVTDEAAEEAAAILAERPGATDADEVIAQSPADIEIADEPEATSADDEDEPSPNLREQTADRALRGALFALFLFPLELYVFYLLIKVFNSDLPLAPRHRRNAWIAAGINLPCVVLMLLFVKGLVVG
jgi:Putative prokaryotic signal transducing protein